jgi:hypothetical protein
MENLKMGYSSCFRQTGQFVAKIYKQNRKVAKKKSNDFKARRSALFHTLSLPNSRVSCNRSRIGAPVHVGAIKIAETYLKESSHGDGCK